MWVKTLSNFIITHRIHIAINQFVSGAQLRAIRINSTDFWMEKILLFELKELQIADIGKSLI